MKKKILLINVLFLITISIVTASTLLFIFPYDPLEPPKAIEDGWTVQGVQEVVNANNKFAFDMYEELSKNQGNLFFSPYSISVALAMTYEGAAGQTAEEIKEVFHFPEKEILRPNSARIYNEINNPNKSYTLRTGNALWADKTFELRQDYSERVEKYYGGKAVNMDFINEPELSRETINTFIAEQTNNRIKNLLPEGIIDAAVRLILTNAIYFLGDWEYPFDEKNTRERPFYVSPEESIDVPMMYMNPEENFNYASLEDLELLEMPYEDNELSMLILLPKTSLEELELNFEKLNEYIGQMRKTNLDGIFFPKFELETEYELVEPLKNMGMSAAFLNADFSNMNEHERVFISDVIHKAFVNVDEEGTEAAAATAVIIRETAIMEPRIFNANRPFIFLIRENESGNILFMGRINNPLR